MSITKKF